MKLIFLEVNAKWLLTNTKEKDGQKNIEAVMQRIADRLTKKYEGRVDGDPYVADNEVRMFIDVSGENGHIEKSIEEALQLELGISLDSIFVDCEIRDYETSPKKSTEAKEKKSKAPAANGIEFLLSQIEQEKKKRGIADANSETESTDQKETEEQNLRWLEGISDKLVGCDGFLELLRELWLVSSRVKKYNTQRSFAFRHYLFAVNYGSGFTSYIKTLDEALVRFGLLQDDVPGVVPEFVLEEPKPNTQDPCDVLYSQIVRGFTKKKKLVCIDISRWLHRIDDPSFRNLLLSLSKLESNVFVFRVPFLEKEVLDKVYAGINDILYVKTVSVPPVSNEDLIRCASVFLGEYGYTLRDDALPILEQKLIEEKSDGRFYGFKTVKKLTDEFILQKQLSDAKNQKDDTVICADDLSALTRELQGEVDGLQQLKDMVGMEDIVKKVEEIVASITLSKKVKDVFAPSLHMRFLGNPGTGKTTVARLIGKILAESGVLRNGSFFEISGRDLCGRFIGETAPKTAAICRDAYGSVLFIDEAYSLYRGDENKKDFGIEALETLIAEMENHRDDLVVIMAGYSQEMQELMQGNKGLESRMPYVIEFPNYDRDQLFLIFQRMVGDLKCGEGFFEEAKSYFSQLPDSLLNSKSFSNARYVRNIFQSTCSKAATRMYLNKGDEFVLKKEDFRSACSERQKDELLKKRPRSRIGF